MLTCPNCQAWLRLPETPGPAETTCPQCDRRQNLVVFPAIRRPSRSEARPETLLESGEASCFHHPGNRASVVCDECGRFLCNVCDIPLQGLHYCPSCVKSGVGRRSIEALENRRVLYGHLALAVAVFPILTVWFTALGAPTAIGIAVAGWKKPGSITGRGSHLPHIFAIFIALLEMTVWALFLVGVFD
jgi:hypothetical protein